MLKFAATEKSIAAHKSGCLLVGAHRRRGKPVLSAAALQGDRAANGLLSEVVRRGDFKADAGSAITLHLQSGPHQRIILAGFGDENAEAGVRNSDPDNTARRGMEAAFAQLRKSGAETALSALSAQMDENALLCEVSAAARNLQKYRPGAWGKNPPADVRVDFAVSGKARRATFSRAAAAAEGGCLARHLAEQPGNVCDPPFLSKTANWLAKNAGLKTTVFEEKRIRELKMGGLLAVARGSVKPPQFIIMSHRGGPSKSPPVVLVGKGVTFDTGGISLKPGAAMDEMKFDMGGAASVFGAMLFCARAKLPMNVVGVVPACENMPDGAALKPGDVITAMNGKTIEVLNTDAEGRLILADALFYASRNFNPSAMVDMATLTGACVVALGREASGLMSADDSLANELLDAGSAVADPAWRLPMWGAHQRLLKSEYADMGNIGGREAGTLSAGRFLQNFVGETKSWAHLDIAGTAWTKTKRATGRPVDLLAEFLHRRAARGERGGKDGKK